MTYCFNHTQGTASRTQLVTMSVTLIHSTVILHILILRKLRVRAGDLCLMRNIRFKLPRKIIVVEAMYSTNEL